MFLVRVAESVEHFKAFLNAKAAEEAAEAIEDVGSIPPQSHVATEKRLMPIVALGKGAWSLVQYVFFFFKGAVGGRVKKKHSNNSTSVLLPCSFAFCITYV